VNKIKYAVAVVLFVFFVNYSKAEERIVYPAIKDVNLPNGFRVLLIEHHEQKTISYRMLVKAGKADEQLGKEGIAGFTSRMLQEGTQARTSDQIADEFAGIGSGFNISSMPSYVIFGVDVINEYSQNGLDLFSDLILKPTFPADGIKRVRKEMLNSVDLDQTDNDTIAFNFGRAILFECKNPLGRTNTKQSIRSISAKDIGNFYESHYYPANSIMLVIGDFSSEEMFKQVNEKFGEWKQTETAKKAETKADYNKKGKVFIVDKPKLTQAVMYFNQWAVTSGDEHYYEYLVANYILGGSDFSSRLMTAVRSKGGKTYHVGSYCNINRSYGVLNISTFTRNAELYNTYKLIQSEIERLNKDGITEEELRKAKDYFSGAIPLQLESPSQIANKILNAIMLGFTVDDLSREVINCNKVTADGVNGVIRQYMNIGKLNAVIVCDTKSVKEQLKQIGEYEQVSYKDNPCK
jgi:predicted Zn-dependent peptidase